MERLNNLYTFERSQHNFRANQLTVRSCLSSSFFIRLPICGLFCDCWCSSSIAKTDYVLAASPTSLGCFWFLFCTKKARVLYRLLVSLLKASRIAPIVWRATRRAHAGLLAKVLMHWLSTHSTCFILLVIPLCSHTFGKPKITSHGWKMKFKTCSISNHCHFTFVNNALTFV